MASAVAIGASAFSTMSKFGDETRQAEAMSAKFTYESAADEINAKVAHLQSVDAIERGDIEAAIRGQQTRQQIGQTRASFADQGVVVGRGSAGAAESSEAYVGAIDEATIRNNAARQAWGYDVESSTYTQRAALARAAAANEQEGYEPYSTLLTGAARTYGLFKAKSR